MRLKHQIKSAVLGLTRHKSRTFLTILGIVIGVTSIMLIMALGKGAEDLILGELQGMGTKTVVVLPGREPKGPSDTIQTFGDSLKDRDFEALKRKENVPNLASIMPIVFGSETASAGSETYHITIFGADAMLQKIFNIELSEGEFFDENDVKGKSGVVLIGSKVKEELFENRPALGEKIRIKNRTFRIIGIMDSRGQTSFFNFDEMAVVPYTTAKDYLFGIKYYHRFVIEVDTEENIPTLVKDVETVLRDLHDITNPDKDDFYIETQADIVDSLGMIMGILTAFLSGVAGISLFVGGVGIMNIMLVSVTERTKEIGLRKALGAKNRDILRQFLIEATILTSVGGFIGIILGTSFGFLSAIILSHTVAESWTFVFPLKGALLGIGVSVSVGLIFGIYPAKEASKKSPLEALRYE